MRNGLLIVVVVLGVLAGFAVVLQLTLPDANEARNIAAMVQASVTALAIAVAGVFAGAKLQVFRDFEPHLTISHDISHRRVGDSYVHIFVTATLRNSSKVAVDIRRAMFWLQHVSHVSDEEVERLHSDVFERHIQQDLQWPLIEERVRTWKSYEVMVEPGETHSEPIEFIVGSAAVETVMVYTYFYNPRYGPGRRSAEGWGTTSVIDIIERK